MNAAFFGCRDRKQCYEAVSRKNLGSRGSIAARLGGRRRLSVLEQSGFIGVEAVRDTYLPLASNFKIEGGVWAAPCCWNFCFIT